MADRSCGECFLTKTRHQFRIVPDEIRQNDLDREQRFQICVASLVNDAHTALAEPQFEVVFALEHRFARDGMRGRHAVRRTRDDFVRKAMFTELTLSHRKFMMLKLGRRFSDFLS